MEPAPGSGNAEIRLPAAMETWPLERVLPYARNPWQHSEADVEKLAAGIRAFGFNKPIEVDEDGVILAGHRRRLAAIRLGMAGVPVIQHLHLSAAEKRAYRIADNRLTLDGEWDQMLLAQEAEEIATEGLDLALTGFEQEELDRIIAYWTASQGEGSAQSPSNPGEGRLAERFLVPPFSVLNAREGWWQERKRWWLALGIQSELGRIDGKGWGAEAAAPKGGGGIWQKRVNGSYQTDPKYAKAYAKPGGGGLIYQPPTSADPSFYSKKRAKEAELGRELTTEEFIAEHYEGEESAPATGTSIFDPVLCELVYRWFSPPHGAIVDPFAGGSVRGIVAAKLGRLYTGIDLRPEQAAANEEQWTKIGSSGPRPRWVVGDGVKVAGILSSTKADLVFSCPPYADLEVYSDDPQDLSTMPYDKFLEAYCRAVAGACSLLLNNRFACFVVGDVRDERGLYRNFVSDTITAFRDSGLALYNEAILVTAVGSLPIRAGRYFSAARKLGKTHQNVLVFVKGDPRLATEACGPVEIAMPEEVQPEA